jgi:FtsP/CotA-like multicopper oxidase with cupredoxin domain
VHFHGTHTTPATTGDNVLLFVRPALRSGKDRSVIRPRAALVNAEFDKIWAACEAKGTPTEWKQLPLTWRTSQEALLKEYDRTAPYRGKPGGLPHDMQLWPANKAQIDAGVWPQYQLGAYPYCFRLANFYEAGGHPPQTMGQSPGTHWYHAHKHGSTALNVANGMTGAFVIEGQYDDDLRRFYGSGFRDQVLLIQQLSSQPFPVLQTNTKGPGTVGRPQLSVNGRLTPVIHMRPGEVQLWRIVNANYRDAVQFQSIAPATGLAWRQIAQDGVQFAFANYNTLGAMNRPFNLAPANRADVLVRASNTPGTTYTIAILPNEGLKLDPGSNRGTFPGNAITLMTVKVDGPTVSPVQDFIQQESDFPKLPDFLKDIPAASITKRRTLDFGAVHNLIDGKTFDQNRYSQVMELNDAEEWTIKNEAGDKAHPFHIHINPFQITEVFQPNLENTKDPNQPCYVDWRKPETWKPCTPITGPFVWWDTFAIPTSLTVSIPKTVCTTVDQCPAEIQQYITCDPTTDPPCSVTIPGYFKMRTRFVDYTGAYVVHCHILIHEDRGMMQLVEVVPDKPPYVHK